jgi:predicted Rossmann fold nucleotide-binding protein DprA/Smf involved in DNA uptake
MILGFTGTRHGLTEFQGEGLAYLLNQMIANTAYIVHGGCVGADDAFHHLVREKFPEAKIIIYPSNIPKTYMGYDASAEYMPSAPPLIRNKRIVNACHLLIACPGEEKEIVRSGTWATIRYAHKNKKPIFIVTPAGTIHMDLPPALPK